MKQLPDIFIIYTDQQRWNTLFSPLVHTPNLDRLRQRGCTMKTAYSSSPVCMSARTDFLTGRSAKYHGYWVNADRPAARKLETFPEMLCKQGYRTVAVGKMHHYPPTEKRGWEELYLMEEIPEAIESDCYTQYLLANGIDDVLSMHGVRSLLYHSPQKTPIPERHHGTSWVADKSIGILNQHQGRPLCMMSSWIDPHPPWSIPASYLDKYRDASLPETVPAPENSPYAALLPQDIREIKEAYYASCEFVDRHIGRLLDALEAAGKMNDAYIFFMSDHGEMLGDRNMYQKFCAYDASARIPMIAVGSGFTPGTFSEIPVTDWDVTATILDIAGIDDIPADMIGESLLAPMPDDRIICFHHGGDTYTDTAKHERYVAAVGQGYKYIHSYCGGGRDELYHLNDDPDEMNNLAVCPDFKNVLDRLKQAAVDFELRHGQSSRIEDNHFINEAEPPPLKNGFFGARLEQLPYWKKTEDAFSEPVSEIIRGLRENRIILPDDKTVMDNVCENLHAMPVAPDIIEIIMSELAPANHTKLNIA